MGYMWRDRKLLTLLGTGSLIVMTGAVMAPILPQMVQQLDLDQALAGYLVSTHYLTVVIFSPLLGILADRTGKVRVLVISLLLYAIFGAAGGVMHGFVPILVTRGLVGAASGGIAAPSLGLLVRRYESEEARSQAIAYVASALTLANIVYPLLAGLIGGWHWRWAFGLYGLGIPLALIVTLNFKQSDFDKRSPQVELTELGKDSQKLKTLIQNPRLLQLYGTQCLTAAIAYGTIIYLPLYLKATVNADTFLIGIILASQAVGAATVSAFGVRLLVKRFSLVGTTSLGFGLMALTLMAIPQLQHLSSLFFVVILFGVGLGLVMPSLYNLVSKVAAPGLQSSVLAVGVGVNFLGQFLSPSLFSLVLNLKGLPGVFYLAASLALTLGLLLMVFSANNIQNLIRHLHKRL